MAGTTIGPFEAEVFHRCGPLRNAEIVHCLAMGPRQRIAFDASWEQPPNDVPRVVEVSADGHFLVAQWGHTSGAGGAAIWDVASKKTVWKVPWTRALTWIGQHVVALETRGGREMLVWYDWETRVEQGSTEAKLPVGQLTHVPRILGNDAANLAGLVWVDQTEGGIELFRRDSSGWTQAAEKGWWQDRCNFVGDAVFSRDGRYLALPVGVAPEHIDNEEGYLGVLVVWNTESLATEVLDFIPPRVPNRRSSPRDPPFPEITGFDSAGSLTVRAQNGQVVEMPFREF